MPRVLLIDHDENQAPLLAAALGERGWDVERAADGTDGLDEARRLSPDCIVLAVELTNMSGYSVCNKLKRDRHLAGIPLVLASAQATAETFAEHSRLRTHAEAYAHKPYDLAGLVATLESLVHQVKQHAPAQAGTDGAPAAPRKASGPARFGEEPSAHDVSPSPFFGEATHSVTEPGEHGAPAPAPSPVPAPAPSLDAPMPSLSQLATDAALMLEKAVDPLNQTRVYENLLASEGDGEGQGQGPHALIDEALQALPPEDARPQLPFGHESTPGEGLATRIGGDGDGDAAQLDALHAQLAALQAAHDALVARCVAAETARDEALAQLEAQTHRLQQIRALVAGEHP